MQPIQDYDYPFYGKTDTIITLLRRTLNYNVRAQNTSLYFSPYWQDKKLLDTAKHDNDKDL